MAEDPRIRVATDRSTRVVLVAAPFRGEYRLSGTKLSIPGHPTIDLNDIKSVNDDLWDRKGILFLDYKKEGQQGQIVLDDFIYDRPPTDAIYDRIADKFGLGGDDADSDEDEDDEAEGDSEIDDTASADRSDR